jgi:protein disulfide-isomerase A6
MVRLSTYLAATAALAINAQAESMYSKKSGVLNLAGTDYDRLIAKSNYTSVRCMLREHLPRCLLELILS